MKNFNRMCLTTLFVCGAYCTSHLHAECSDLIEHHNETITSDLSTDQTEQPIQEVELSSSRDASNPTEVNDVYINIGENPADNAVEISTEISISNQTIDNTITSVETTVDQESPVVEADFDAMVEELAQSGAVENDLSTIEAQPQWKLLLASIASYAISVGISFQQLLTNLLTIVQNSLTGSSTAAKKAPKKI
jgi:hypothetical protein